jgi:predicted nucleotidyltransferase
LHDQLDTGPVRDIVDKVVVSYDPDRLILFGSYSNGTSTQFSDVDLLVVKDDALPPSERGRNVRQLFYTSPIRVDLVFRTPEEIEDAGRTRDSFLASILEQGVEVHRKPRRPGG